jgi:Right handed beta helix region
MNKALVILFPFFFISGIAGASDLTINPTGSSDQNVINQALESVYNSGGGIVYLNAGVYNIDNQILIGSNTKLTGDPNAIIKVSSSSSQWFPDGTGIIGSLEDSLHNVEICGFQIDGSCENLPPSYANSGLGNHNAERLIDFRCDSGNVGTNISIHDMKIYDAYSDGFHIAFAHGIYCYNNFFSNCQHDAIFYINVVGGEIYNNRIEGITDDCVRFDNCQMLKIHDNLLYTYKGNNNHGSFEDGANGIQGGDEGFSHGGGSAKSDYVDNVEIYNNLIENMGLAGIQLDTTGQNKLERVLIHHNTIVNCGYESNAAWGAGIALDPWVSGMDIEYNTFDNCFQAAILILDSIGSSTATIKNNNILNTQGNGQSSGGLSSSLVGYGIQNLASLMSLDIENNYFSGNLKGDCTASMLNTVSSMVQGAGGNGASIIGNLPSIPTVNQKGATVPEKITSIFDILNYQFTNSSHVVQDSIYPNETWMKKGAYTKAWLDVPVYNDTIKIGNNEYVLGSPINAADVQYGTLNLAEYPDSQEISKSLIVEPENKLRVDLTVTTNYKIPETNHIKVLGYTLTSTSYNHGSETETFSKTFDTPKQFPTLSDSNFNVTVTYYNNSYDPHTLVYVDSSYQNLISEVHYSSNNSFAVDYQLIGMVIPKSNGAKITNFQNESAWKFSDNQMSYSYGGLYIKGKFDLSKFNVTVKTPYSSYEIKNYNYTIINDPTDHVSKNTIRTGLLLVFLIPLFVAIFKELRLILRRLN